jgi:hypothetical protein
VNANPEGVAEAILHRAAECLDGTHPQPLPFQEGEKEAPALRLNSPPWKGGAGGG